MIKRKSRFNYVNGIAIWIAFEDKVAIKIFFNKKMIKHIALTSKVSVGVNSDTNCVDSQQKMDFIVKN